MQTDNNHLRRIRLISDILEDYQENIHRALRLIETEQSMISQDTSPNQTYGNIFANANTRDNATPTFGNILVNTNSRENLNNYIHLQNETSAPIRRTVISDSGRSEFRRYAHNATTPITWDASMHQLRCPITWDSFTPGQSVLKINGCGHIFSRDAIIEWFRRRNHCPVCRSLPVLTEQPRNYGNSSASLSNSYNITTSFITVDPSFNTSDISGNIHAQPEYILSTNNATIDATMDSIINNLTTAILQRLEFGRDQSEEQSDATLPQIGQSGNNIIQNNEYYNDQLLFSNVPFNDAEEILPTRSMNGDM